MVQRNMLVEMRPNARTFVATLVEKLYGDIDLLETQIALSQQEEPLIVTHLLSIQIKLRECLRLAEEESLALEE
jgi:hypothetical protein